MKKYIVLFLILIFSAFSFGCTKKEKHLNDLETIKQRGYIIAGVKGDSPPFGYHDKDGILIGVDIEIVKSIAQEIFDEPTEDRIQYVLVEPQNRISKLNTKEVDILVATLSINPKRRLVLDFSIPYFVASQKLMVKKDSKITNLNYFNKNGDLAVIMGTTGEKVLHKAAPNARVLGAKNYSQAIQYLKEGFVDGILGDDCILEGYNNGDYKIINRAYSREFYAVGVRKNQDSKELLEVVNSAIKSILDEKKINIVKKMYN